MPTTMRPPAEAALRAELATVLAHAEQTGEVRLLEGLLADACSASPSLRLRIECDLEALRSRTREVTRSVTVLAELERRAADVLSESDTTLMVLRSLHAQYVRRRAAPGDGALSVRMCADEMERRTRLLGPADPLTAIARANYAVALRSTGREEDIEQALELLEAESEDRLTRYSHAHPFTWSVVVVLAYTYLRAADAREHDPATRKIYAWKAEESARSLLDWHDRRYGGSDRSTLRAHLVHAEALLMLGRAEEAEPDIRSVLEVAQRPGVALDPGTAELLLARSLAGRAPTEALHYANKALRALRAYHGAASRQTYEAEQVVARLS
jgi:ribosomal protein L12E/L44/L45/RPP1/RPP2